VPLGEEIPLELRHQAGIISIVVTVYVHCENILCSMNMYV